MNSLKGPAKYFKLIQIFTEVINISEVDMKNCELINHGRKLM
jgi:hypothetical protein